MKAEQEALKALQKRVMQLASDSGPLTDAFLQKQCELSSNFMQAIRVSSKREENKQGATGRPEPPGAPPRWQNLDLQGHARFAPGTAIGCALHSEPIDARMQSGVVHKPLFAPHFVPVRIELLQLVTIAIRRRIQVTEGGKLQREHVLPVREGQGICISDGLVDRQTASNLNRTTGQPTIRENDPRHVHVVTHRA